MGYMSTPEMSFVRQVNITVKRGVVKVGVEGPIRRHGGLRKEYMLEEMESPWRKRRIKANDKGDFKAQGDLAYIESAAAFWRLEFILNVVRSP